MKNILNNKEWNSGKVQVHLDSIPITLIESKNDEKLDKYCVKIKLRRYTTSQK